jgi:hypothetical protein
VERRARSRTVWVVVGAIGVVVLALLGACGENLLAPGNGTCPAYCPPERVSAIDSILADNIERDTSVVGYVLPYEAGGLQLVSDSTAPVLKESRVVIRFFTFPDSVLLNLSDTTLSPVTQLDSFAIQLPVRDRSLLQTGLELVVYRLPITVDTTTSFADLDPYFADSALIAIIPVGDSVIDSTVTARLDPSVFPTFEQDGRRAAVGVALRAPAGGVLTLGSVDANDGAVLQRYMQVDSAGTNVARSDGKLPELDTFVGPPRAAPGPGILSVGGSPSARALLRVNLPPRIADSSTIVRATLLLLPAAPVFGAPGDSLRIIAAGVGLDVGPKSPVLGVSSDSLIRLLATVPPGWTDTVRLDVTTLLVGWARDSTRPRTLVLRAIPEGNGFAELWFGSSTAGALRPRLEITFVPPITLGGR